MKRGQAVGRGLDRDRMKQEGRNRIWAWGNCFSEVYLKDRHLPEL
jgi:hypothetical protein